MAVVNLPGRLAARWQAERLLRDGSGMAADPERAGGAEPVLRQALECAREARSDHLVASAGEELYQLLARLRRHEESVPLARELLGCRSRWAGRTSEAAACWRNELVRLLGQLGLHAEAEPFCRERLALAREDRQPSPQAVGLALVTLAWCVRGLGRWDEAETLCREALDVLARDPSRASDGWALAGLAAVLLRRLALDEAEAALRRATQAWASVGRSELAHLAEEQLLDVYVVAERHADALALSTSALGRSRRGATVVGDRERQLRNLERHAFLLQATGREAEAARYETRAEYLRRAIEAEARRGDGSSPNLAGPVFEGEPLPDWRLPGPAIAARAC
ncbi:MAG TPA: tetratricopeptide repeat protein [Terriglobales bacterium]|nr:tetratricopeptide repeat protein [Terriglobales bacterium]